MAGDAAQATDRPTGASADSLRRAAHGQGHHTLSGATHLSGRTDMATQVTQRRPPSPAVRRVTATKKRNPITGTSSHRKCPSSVGSEHGPNGT